MRVAAHDLISAVHIMHQLVTHQLTQNTDTRPPGAPPRELAGPPAQVELAPLRALLSSSGSPCTHHVQMPWAPHARLAPITLAGCPIADRVGALGAVPDRLLLLLLLPRSHITPYSSFPMP
jgi:hypothetical protein